MNNMRQLDAECARLLRAEVTLAAELLRVSELSQAELLESKLLQVLVHSPLELQLLESAQIEVYMPLLPESELLEQRMKVPDLALCSCNCWADVDLTPGQGPAKSCSCDWGWVAGGLGDGCQEKALGCTLVVLVPDGRQPEGQPSLTDEHAPGPGMLLEEVFEQELPGWVLSDLRATERMMHDYSSAEDMQRELNAANREVCRCLKTGKSPAHRLGSA